VYRARYPEEAAAVAAAPTVRPVAPFGWIAFAVQQPNASSLADSGGHRAAVTGLEIRMDARLRERLNWPAELSRTSCHAGRRRSRFPADLQAW